MQNSVQLELLGYERGKYHDVGFIHGSVLTIVRFNWDETQSSQAVNFESEKVQLPAFNAVSTHDPLDQEYANDFLRPITVTVSDGTTFKTVVGDQPMTPGGRYFFELKVKAGYLMKVGICRKADIDVEKVSADFLIGK